MRVCFIHKPFCDTQQNTMKRESVFYPQILKELAIDPSLVTKQTSARLRANQFSPQLLPLSQTNRQLRNRNDHNLPQRRIDRQLSKPGLSNPT